jgi:hypothetical protein
MGELNREQLELEKLRLEIETLRSAQAGEVGSKAQFRL